MLYGRSPRNRNQHRRVVKQPSQRNLSHGSMMLLGNLVKRPTRLGKLTRRNRKPRNERQTILLAILQRLLVLSIAQVVLILYADNLDRLICPLDFSR